MATWGTFVLFISVLLALSSAQINFPGASGGNRFRPGQSPRPRPQSPSQPASTTPTALTNACNCVAAASCAGGRGQAKHGCYTEQRQTGICCVEQTSTVSTRVGLTGTPSTVNVPSNIVQEGLTAGQQIISRILQQTQSNLQNGLFLPKQTPARAHAFFFARSPSALAQHKQAYLNARASAEIAKMQKLTPAQAMPSLTNIESSVQTRTQCLREQVPRCNPSDRYRTVDGTCNNLRNPNFGKSETALSRLGGVLYDDGVMSPRQLSIGGDPLVNVRDISSTVLLDVDNPSPAITLNVMQWAQFVDHDLTHVPFEDMNGEAIQCCRNGQVVQNLPEQCFPIKVSPADGFFRQFQQQCINFVRSMLALRPGCSFGPAEQMNALTHWLDGSMIYGSTEREARNVREAGTPFLRVSANNLLPMNSSLDCEARVPASCFVAGDSRSNEQPGLTATHVYWVREHNRIARALQQLHPQVDPNTLFEEARRIVVAQVQHITYNEWLPIIVGVDAVNKYRLAGPTNYDSTIDPAMSNEFATAAFRFGHSLVQGVYFLPSENNRMTTLRLRDTFNDPGLFQRSPELVDSFARALVRQSSQDLDNLITEDLSNHLFEVRGSRFGMDLMSLNLQRGRDHGISTYADMRRYFNIGSTNSFPDLVNTTPEDLIIRLQSVYEFVDDIDLFTGGMTEKSVRQGLLGPTFANIVGFQFAKIRHGDRFFYDVQGQPGSFSPAQVQEIKKSSMARIFCDNSKIGQIQPRAFLLANNRNNPTTPCQNIPSINLAAWA